MKIQLNPPLIIEQDGCNLFPAADAATADDRLFIVTDNAALAQTLIAGINDRLSARRMVRPDDFDTMLDDAMPAAGERQKTDSLALALMQRNGCLVAQMGKSRVMHVNADGEVEYDSRNQIMDTYNSKARIQVLTNLKAGDHLVVSLADRIDAQTLAEIFSNAENDDYQRKDALTALLSKNRQQAPATFLLTMAGGGGMANAIGQRIKDVNWKWMLIYVLLLAAIAALAWASLTGQLRMPSFSSSAPADTVPAAVEAPQTDTMAPPADAVSIPEESVIETDQPSQKEPSAPERTEKTEKVEKPEPTKNVEPPVAEPEPEPVRQPDPVVVPEEPATPIEP